MTETVITVQGRDVARHAAERAVVRLGVSFDGPARDAVFTDASTAAESLRGAIESLHDSSAGPITTWSSDSIQVWSDRPWNQDGKQLPLVYHARIGFTAEFDDFDALSRFLERQAAADGVAISWVEWKLTDERKDAATTEVRARAVADATRKAQTYADAIGLTRVRAIAIADPGMLGDQSSASGGGFEFAAAAPRMMKASMDSAASPELSLKPEEIEVAAVVDARFVASAG
ncbi:MAG: SIMPL domain-containing protein [Cryobacterium sp.]|nr:SIMPL domain-containing protein [Cryobacterium sp.]